MAPGAHLLFSWLSTVELLKNRRERTLVTLTGVAPDLDGLGLLADRVTGTTDYYFRFHHYIGHGVVASICLASFAALLAKTQRGLVFFLALFVVHLHILCDVIGSRGPDGYQWPIYYLHPYNSEFELTWSGQWALNAWQNQLILIFLIGLCVFYGATKKITFFEIFSRRFNNEVFKMYNKYLRKSA